MVEMNVDTSSFRIGASRSKISTLKAAICFHTQARNFIFWPEQILNIRRISKEIREKRKMALRLTAGIRNVI